MKPIPFLTALLVLAAGSLSWAQDAKPLLHDRALPVIAAPDFSSPLDAKWSAVKGTWTPEHGVLTGVELPEQKHAAVLHHLVGLESAVIECEFRFDGPAAFLIGCDSDKHVGRVVIKPTGMDIAEDSTKPSHIIESLKMEVKAGEWHRLRVEWQGDRMAASLDGQAIRAQHAFLATPKARSWLAVSKSVKVRGLKISGIVTTAKP